MLQTAFRKEAVCFGAGKAARHVHGGGTTASGELDLLFLGEPRSWPSIHAKRAAAWGTRRGPRGGGAEAPGGPPQDGAQHPWLVISGKAEREVEP